MTNLSCKSKIHSLISQMAFFSVHRKKRSRSPRFIFLWKSKIQYRIEMIVALLPFLLLKAAHAAESIQLGPRPYFLLDKMKDGELKERLSDCAAHTEIYRASDFSIGHRGACLLYPEHTLESYEAALIQGAGIVECDVTFTRDMELICRHAQCDLHTTTNVVTIPEMNAKCTTPWSEGVTPECCASDFTLAEIKTLCAKMDASVSDAATPEEYIGGVADFRTTLYSAECPRVPTHQESIDLIKEHGAKFTPELKSPSVDMPFEGSFTQEDYAQKLIDEYIAADVPPSEVWPQSFLWTDVIYWINNTDFGDQAVALEGTYDAYGNNETAMEEHFKDIVDAGAKIIAPPMWMLVDQEDGEMVSSAYTNYVKEQGMDIITWTLERSGNLESGGGWYYQSLNGEMDPEGHESLVEGDGFMFEFLEFLHEDVGILGIFSDWPATTTFYANCMEIALREEPDVTATNGMPVASVQLGSRPYYLLDKMQDSELKTKLEECAATTEEFEVSDFSIGHRGACLKFPEHTLESYEAASVQGAGIVECDVTFTQDLELICRHAQCDLHTTTNVVTIPEMNAKCTTPWSEGVAPECCASDFTLAEIKTLCAKMDASVSDAATPEEYIGGVADFRTNLYSAECPRVPTHMESITAIAEYDGYYTPELKTPQVDMPFNGFTQEDYAQKLIDEYIAAGVPPEKVWPQSFLWSDVIYWINNTDFGDQAVALEGTYDAYGNNETAMEEHFKDIVDAGAKIIAPPMWMLVDQEDGEMVSSAYTNYVKEQGMDIITWTLERSGNLETGGGWYYQSLNGEMDPEGHESLVEGDGFMFEFLEFLHEDVGIVGIFSDWPATTTFYANCMNIGIRGHEDDKEVHEEDGDDHDGCHCHDGVPHCSDPADEASYSCEEATTEEPTSGATNHINYYVGMVAGIACVLLCGV